VRRLALTSKTLVRLGVAIAVVLAVAIPAAVALRGGDENSRVRIEPADGLLDAPLRFEVEGFDGGSRVRLTLSATSGDGVRWAGSRTVLADAGGSVSIDGGTLLASLLPIVSPIDRRAAALLPSGNELELRLDVRDRDDVVGTARATRRMAAEGVSSRDLVMAKDGLVGRFSTGGSDDARRVALLVLGGSEGGVGHRPEPALLASHGYPTLKLAYFREKGLPQELSEIPLEYLVRGLEWLRKETGARRIVVIGASRGAELALILGSRFPELVDGVVAYAPSSVVYPGLASEPSAAWTYRGKPLETISLGTTRASNRAAVIPVERINGPVMTVAGLSDQVWPAAIYAAAIAERRAAFGKHTVTLVYQDAGHYVGGIPYLPVGLGAYDLDSTRKAGALARTEGWRRLLALLDEMSRTAH
jgi:pimeloyl-ACP methyl ester carboxylesterase